ncbi:four helix bundle protein [Hyphococcus sp.]|uniref:four helix bundle protein n=1 Tax=Hyphococcus sp. TaxID=2038636 RepID=UPI0035C684DB
MKRESTFQSYQDLLVWQAGMTLAESCYLATARFPREEMFGLTSQIRRSAASIPANIAEGHGRENSGSFVQHLRISQGSLKELETHLILSRRVGLLAEADLQSLLGQCAELGKMLRSLIRSIQQKNSEK